MNEIKHGNFKGDNAGNDAKHKWIQKLFGKANKCENKDCINKNPKRFDWASINHTYTRNREDWLMLCVPCHRKMDYGNYCKRGHPLFGDNCYVSNRNGKNYRCCKICKYDYDIRNREIIYERKRIKRLSLRARS